MQSPIQAPIQGGGALGAPGQSPIQAPIQGGGQSPMQVPMAPSAVQGAAGGGQLAQPAPVPAPAPVATAAPAAATIPSAVAPAAGAVPSTGAQPAPPVSGGGPIDMTALVPVLTQLVEALNGLVAAMSGAAGVQGGGGTPTQGGGCGMAGCAHGQAGAAGVQQVTGDPSQGAGRKKVGGGGATTQAPTGPATGGNGKLDGEHTVKGAKMTAEQKRLTEIVLQVGQKMGANRKVLETAVSTMIQESTIKNDSSVDSKDHDSLGLFQQRPSAGWGTRAQISDPEYAAKKFFEKAIPNDRKNPDLAKTRLAQSVQISAYPDAYAKWDKEAEQIVADFLG